MCPYAEPGFLLFVPLIETYNAEFELETDDASPPEAIFDIPPVRFGSPGAFQVPAFLFSSGPQFRKNLWPLRNYRPELDFWRCQQSFRNWTQQGDAEAGAWEQDAIRNITGTAGQFKSISERDRFSGAFTRLLSTGGSDDSNGTGPAALSFDASLVVPTGPQNVPQHVWQPAVLYLGRPA